MLTFRNLLVVKDMYRVVLCLMALADFVTNENRLLNTKPGDFAVLQNTTATFGWRHGILNLKTMPFNGVNKTVNDVGISWFYHGSHDDQFTMIMSYTASYGIYKSNSTQADRLHYLEGPDSAAMQLDRVTSGDEGFYQVRVFDPNTPIDSVVNYHDIDEVKVDVIQSQHLRLNVTIESQKYANLGPPPNGSAIRLPSLSVSVPDRVYVNISVSQTAPLPDIKMATTVGDVIQPELPCEKTYFCDRDIPLMTEDAHKDTVRIAIDVYFDIQNVKPCEITVLVNVSDSNKTQNEKHKHNPYFVSTWVLLTVILGLVVCLVVLFRKCRGHRQRHNSKPPESIAEVQPLAS